MLRIFSPVEIVNHIKMWDLTWSQGRFVAKQTLNMYSETLNNEYIERIYKMSYSSLSDNGIMQIFSFLIK